jgi:hypothetical protein
MKKRTPLFLFALLLSISPHVWSKGNFQAEGTITAVDLQANSITFRFSGKIRMTYATAAESLPARSARVLEFEAHELPVEIREWTEPHKPSVKATTDLSNDIHSKLLELARSGHRASVSVDNPELGFTNTGELVRIGATFLYAVDAEEIERLRRSAKDSQPETALGY